MTNEMCQLSTKAYFSYYCSTDKYTKVQVNSIFSMLVTRFIGRTTYHILAELYILSKFVHVYLSVKGRIHLQFCRFDALKVAGN